MASKKDAPTFDFELVVIHQYEFVERGTRISDPAAIQEVIDKGYLHHCHKVAPQVQ